MIRSVVAVIALSGVSVTGALVVLATTDAPKDSTTTALVTRVIDGDTLEIASGERVRLIGVDTPERGTCGYEAATKAMRWMVEGREVSLLNPGSVQDLDRYDRLLRFVDVGDKDSGYRQITGGRAQARYDSLDGYDEHPRESRYREADRAVADLCGTRQRLSEERQERHAMRELHQSPGGQRWSEARRLANKAGISIGKGETAVQVLRRAKAAISEPRQLLRHRSRSCRRGDGRQTHSRPATPAVVRATQEGRSTASTYGNRSPAER